MSNDLGSLTSTRLPETMRGRWYNSDHFDPDNKWSGFAPKSSAVVLVDMVNWQIHPDGASARAVIEGSGVAGTNYKLERCETVVIPALRSVLSAARAAGARVVHVRLASRAADYSDIVPGMQPYLRAAEAIEGSWGSQVLDGLSDPRDISIVKSASGAYNSSDLDQVLRNLGVRTVLYAGVLTNACVLLTAAAGYDLGYRQYLLTDCTAALSDEDQHYAERFIGNYMAQAATAVEAVNAFVAAAANDCVH